jgi:uncharacterized integral membrane protein (TIGR00697 family)
LTNPSYINTKTEQAKFLYLSLAALFITALVSCNLIANKFVSVDLGFKVFVVSAGVLPYPLTFLITDILSEIFGRRKTNQVVLVGFFASLFVLLILRLGGAFPAIDGSPVSDTGYNQVFQNSERIILASMLAYLVAQFVDVRLYHFWKKLTKGQHLWLRNNFSTILSQLMDTILVTSVIFFGTASFSFIGDLVIDGWFFKVLCALVDTLFIYLIVYAIRRFFKLKGHEELVV